MSQEKDTTSNNFQDTLNLPRTDFPIRAYAEINDPKILERWKKENLFSTSFYHNDGKEKFILHDGPPYANGHTHIGHAYNKILKDILTKSQRMQNKHVPITPGWDCHGLPIEFKVSQEVAGQNLSANEFKKACRAYANKWIAIQKEEFKNLGILMDWDNPYLTMDFSYEASILQAFGTLIQDGYIDRKNKTVPWCASCQTVLAIAEIEYKDRKDPSIYVRFPLTEKTIKNVIPALQGKSVSLLVWTTTPWTLPLNRAVLLRPDAEYVVLQNNENFIIVGKTLADALCQKVGMDKQVVATCNANLFFEHAAQVHHPFIDDLTVPVLLSDTVLLSDGTAVVHCAPGCGPEDYEIGVKNNLEIYAPVAADGTYQESIAPIELLNMSVHDGQIWVIKKLAEKNMLFYKTTITHSYPHCWRCHKGLIFRATKQWFCDLAKNNLKSRALTALKEVKTFPSKSVNSLSAAVDGRLEWCLSRQRAWGVPIPALLCVDCDATYMSKELADAVADKVKDHGVEYWDTVSIEQLVGKNFTCPSCKGSHLIKEKDILDVWFDSGISHYAVLKKNNNLAFPADFYLEGRDQHRGWFQSSLLTSVILNNVAPMKNLLTHGFTVDKNGNKMSKSLGNVVAPQELINALGTDGLRLWVSSIDYSDDAVISAVLTENVANVYRKIRNTCRFLLSNLYDFNVEKDAVVTQDLLVIDSYALQKLFNFNGAVLHSYNNYNFTAVFHDFADYCSSDLSSFYLDIIKDRLYVERADGLKRRSAQTVCWYILDTLTKLMAPILSFTAEQISDHYQLDKKQSIHLQNFPQFTLCVDNDDLYEESIWNVLQEMRTILLKKIEILREQKIIKHSLEAAVSLYIDPAIKNSKLDALGRFFAAWDRKDQTIEEFLKEFVIVSSVHLVDLAGDLQETNCSGLYVTVQRAEGTKCLRCWHWQKLEQQSDLCERCQNIIKMD